jgi:hypothetical protein
MTMDQMDLARVFQSSAARPLFFGEFLEALRAFAGR